MKQVIYILFISLAFVSCKEEKKPIENMIETSKEDEIEAVSDMLDKQAENEASGFELKNLIGYYVGNFYAESIDHKKDPSFSNRINISIDSIINTTLYGHSVVAGNSRPFVGVVDLVTLQAGGKEPGDDRYDGAFVFKFTGTNKDVLSGTWISNDKSLAVTERKYELKKRIFQYDPNLNLPEYDENEYAIEPLSNSQSELYDYAEELEAVDLVKISALNSSNQVLKNTDVENLSKGELEILRNMIYARHGYSFKNRKMRYFFDSGIIDWYIPVSTDIRKELTDIEKGNIALIKRYEEHADRYYDSFGR